MKVKAKDYLALRFREQLTSAQVPHNYVENLVRITLSWYNDLGQDQLVEKLKQYKLFYVHLLSDPDRQLPTEFPLVELEYGKKGNPKLKHSLLQDFLVRRSAIDIKFVSHARAWFDLIYLFTPDEVSDDAFKKFLKALQTEFTVEDSTNRNIGYDMIGDYFDNFIDQSSRHLRCTDMASSFISTSIVSTKRSPAYYHGRMKTLPRSNRNTLKWLRLWTESPELNKFWKDNRSMVNTCLIGVQQSGLHSEMYPEPKTSAPVPIGTISCILEQGNKHRWIANPHISIQMVSEPLKQCLEEVCRRIPWIYTFDQDAGVEAIRSVQDGNVEIQCTDATSFTDTFDRRFQINVLQQLMLVEDDRKFSTQLIELISSAPYQCTVTEDHQLVSWNSGQPLGTGPSFHLACLSHAMVILISFIYSQLFPEEYNLIQKNGWFALTRERRLELMALANYACSKRAGCVGDDVFIASPRAAQFYRTWLSELNVSVNPTKSITSTILSEFCGKWVYRNEKIHTSKPPLVYGHYDQVLSGAREYGNSFLLGVSYKHVIKPLGIDAASCMPTELGGLDLYLQDPDLFDRENLYQTLWTAGLEEFFSTSASEKESKTPNVKNRKAKEPPLVNILQLLAWYRRMANPWNLNPKGKLQLATSSSFRGRRFNEWTQLPCESFEVYPQNANRRCLNFNTLTQLIDIASSQASTSSGYLHQIYWTEIQNCLYETNVRTPPYAYNPLFKEIINHEAKRRKERTKTKFQGNVTFTKGVNSPGFSDLVQRSLC